MSNELTPRQLWELIEPYHAVVYFSPECRTAMKQSGLRGFWMGYFAGRAAPMGQVAAPVVTATFYNFAPRMVERSIPDAWKFCAPEEVLEARLDGVDKALRRILGESSADSGLAEAALLAEQAVVSIDAPGRPLFSANAALDRPEIPHLRLWWAATCLREHRGDGHCAALVNSGIDGCEAHVTLSATGSVERQVLQDNRGWSDEEWDAASDRLRSRGWLDRAGNQTDSGRNSRKKVEEDTDRMATAPLLCLGPKADRFAELLRPLAKAILASGDVPVQNPIGLPRNSR
jgi:hypothetical protein